VEYCQVCGAPASTEAFLEGARVWLCAKCLRFGKAVAKKIDYPAGVAPLPKSRESVLAEGFGETLKKAREARRLSVPELAKKIFVNEKELAKIEREELRPSEAVARKLERELGVTILVEE